VIGYEMAGRKRPYKEDDYETYFACAGGTGILREEFWVDDSGEVVRYNLAFLLPHLWSADNGRVLGFDNAHGIHERHYFGEVTVVDFETYSATTRRFYREMQSIRRRYEDEDFYRRP
jgi:hypothetical protein